MLKLDKDQRDAIKALAESLIDTATCKLQHPAGFYDILVYRVAYALTELAKATVDPHGSHDVKRWETVLYEFRALGLINASVEAVDVRMALNKFVL